MCLKENCKSKDKNVKHNKELGSMKLWRQYLALDRATRVKVAISTACGLLIVLRLVFPEVKVDAITIGLLVVAVLPWVIAFIDSAKFPGGWEVSFREVRDAGEKIASSAGPASKPAEHQALSFLHVANLDPNLALVGLRIEIEKRVRVLAESEGLSARQPLTRLIRELRARELVPGGALNGIEELVMAGNEAAHGARVDNRVSQWAMDYGPDVIGVLDSLIPAAQQGAPSDGQPATRPTRG